MTTPARPRGLSAASALALGSALAAGAGAYDVMTGTGLRRVFAAGLVLGAVVAATLVRRDGLKAAVVMPPLLHAAVALGAALAEKTGAGGPWYVREALEAATTIVLGAPALLVATGAALGVAVVRATRR